MVGPDGTPIESSGSSGKGGRQPQPSADASGSQPQPNPGSGGSKATPRSQSGKGEGTTPAPTGEAAAPLFQPGAGRPEKNDLREGQNGKGAGGNGLDGTTDPAERAAVAKLRQAVRRIESNKSGGAAPGSGKAEMADTGNRRDW